MELDLLNLDRSIRHIVIRNADDITPVGFDKYRVIGENIQAVANQPLSSKDLEDAVVIVENGGHLAFAHFFYESVVLARYIWAEFNLGARTQAYLSADRVFKRLTMEYFGIPTSLTIKKGQPALIVRRLFSLNTDSDIDKFSQALDWIQCQTVNLHQPKLNDILFLPRQKCENAQADDRQLSYQNFDKLFNGTLRSTVLHTDNITSFGDQVSVLGSHRFIIVPDGSAFLVNGFFARDSTIMVLGQDFVLPQVKRYPKIASIYESIKSRNAVFFVRGRGFTFDGSDLAPILNGSYKY
jgi:hypothetical protein